MKPRLVCRRGRFLLERRGRWKMNLAQYIATAMDMAEDISTAMANLSVRLGYRAGRAARALGLGLGFALE